MLKQWGRINKFSSLIWLWKFLFLNALALIITLLLLGQALQKEYQLTANNIYLVNLAAKLKDASNSLTDSVRFYAQTGDQKYLDEYWNEVNLHRSREKVLSDLRRLNATLQEINLLTQAKEKSDALVETEIRSMKLLLLAAGVPQDRVDPQIRDYSLSSGDERLSAAEKIKRAREIMFDNAYITAKAKITAPIDQFRETATARNQLELATAKKQIQRLLTYLKILLGINLWAIMCMIWLKIL